MRSRLKPSSPPGWFKSADVKEMSERACSRFTVHAVDVSRRDDFVRLFEAKGSPAYCWRMLWRATPEEATHTDGASRKAAMLARIAQVTPVGLLGYLGTEPVAWSSVAQTNLALPGDCLLRRPHAARLHRAGGRRKTEEVAGARRCMLALV
jgi:hypothetical protein